MLFTNLSAWYYKTNCEHKLQACCKCSSDNPYDTLQFETPKGSRCFLQQETLP